MEDSRSVQEFQILGGGGGGHLAISNYWGGLVYGGYGPDMSHCFFPLFICKLNQIYFKNVFLVCVYICTADYICIYITM